MVRIVDKLFFLLWKELVLDGSWLSLNLSSICGLSSYPIDPERIWNCISLACISVWKGWFATDCRHIYFPWPFMKVCPSSRMYLLPRGDGGFPIAPLPSRLVQVFSGVTPKLFGRDSIITSPRVARQLCRLLLQPLWTDRCGFFSISAIWCSLICPVSRLLVLSKRAFLASSNHGADPRLTQLWQTILPAADSI